MHPSSRCKYCLHGCSIHFYDWTLSTVFAPFITQFRSNGSVQGIFNHFLPILIRMNTVNISLGISLLKQLRIRPFRPEEWTGKVNMMQLQNTKVRFQWIAKLYPTSSCEVVIPIPWQQPTSKDDNFWIFPSYGTDQLGVFQPNVLPCLTIGNIIRSN